MQNRDQDSIMLIQIPFEQAVTGERYITRMKHGWIEGYWDAESQSCQGYYWRDIEWWPYELYKIENQFSEQLT